GKSPASMAVGDFDGDGHLDLAVANSGEDSVSVLLGNGDGTFQPQLAYALPMSPQWVAAGDFNGDGLLDLAISGNRVSVLLGEGDGTFQPPVTMAAGLLSSSLVAGDFNGDGRLDLAAAWDDGTGQGNDGVAVLPGNGNGTFGAPVISTPGLALWSL